MAFNNIFNRLFKKGKSYVFGKSNINEQEKLRVEKKNEAIREFLQYVNKYSPWYKKQFKNVPLHLVTEENLIDLPILSKQDLMDNWDEIITEPSLNLTKVKSHLEKMYDTRELQVLDGKYLLLSTGGSSGRKGIFIYNYHTLKNNVITRAKILKPIYKAFVDFDNGEKLRYTQVIVENGVFGMYVFSKIYTAEYEEKHYFPISLPMSDIVDGLNSVQPHILVAIPSTIHLLCHEALKKNLAINPHLIYVGAEPLYIEIRQLIYKIWPHAKLYNFYGASEGFCATSCRPNSHTMHLPHSSHTFIPVNNANQPTKKGQYSDKLLYTYTKSFLLPLINYELEDKIRFLDEPCSCGLSEPLINEPLGRNSHCFIYNKSTIIHPLIFTTPLLSNGNIIEFQVKQTSTGAIIYIVGNGEIPQHKIITTIKKSYKELGLNDAGITIEMVDQIERQQPSGKLKRFIPLDA